MRKLLISIMLIFPLIFYTAESSAIDQQEAFYDNHVSVVFMNVGKADSILLKINDKIYLIDTGDKQSIPALLRVLSVMGVEKVDGLFLTHTHSDHIGGTDALVQRCQVEALYSAEISQNNKKGENKIVKLAEKLGLKHIKLKAGDEVKVEDSISFYVIAPIFYNTDDDNDNSLVLSIELNGKRFLFTGDMQFAEEASILVSRADIASHVLKVGNHGNPDATSRDFAKAVSPAYAVISTNTAIDTDSANQAVINNLYTAKVLLTQNYNLCVKMDVDEKGKISIGDLQPIQSIANLDIVSIDTKEQTITIQNNGQRTDISGYFIFSEKGSEIFVFPKDSIIDAGQTITVACSGGTGDFIWNDKNVWNKKNPDTGILFDRFGNELSRN